MAVPFGKMDAAARRIKIALDNMSMERAIEIASGPGAMVGGVKIGLSMIYEYGLNALLEKVPNISFVDVKLHDIPDQVRGAAAALTKRQVPMFNLHGTGGRAMMAAAREGLNKTAEEIGIEPPKLIAVTILTSVDFDTWVDLDIISPINYADPEEEKRVKDEYIQRIARRIAVVAAEEGLDGVVCSPQNVGDLRLALPEGFLFVTPGIRLEGANAHDQKRTGSPYQAILDGATDLVVGRDFTGASDFNGVFARYVEDIGRAQADRTAV